MVLYTPYLQFPRPQKAETDPDVKITTQAYPQAQQHQVKPQRIKAGENILK